jgi:beta-glucosidase
MVLLKNEDNILPLRKEGTIGVIGAFAKNPRYQGGGSSHINPTKLDNIYDEIEKSAGGNTKVLYAKGYSLDKDDIDIELIDEAKKVAQSCDVVVVFAGLPDRYESECYDRVNMGMPENHTRLIEEEVQSNVVVVLSNGSPVEMPWADSVKGLMEGYLGGQALGGAIADLLFGDVNPCGKLAETFPEKLTHNPSYLNFPGSGDRVEYREGLFVGYKYYDAKEIAPLFPFGFGLSYTSFEYSDITLDKKEVDDEDILTVRVNVRNIGDVYGKEIVQLYVRDVESSMIRPIKELKGFEKVGLQPKEQKTVVFKLDKRAFAYYDVELKDWVVESGNFEILIGRSSKDIPLKENVCVKSKITKKKTYTRNSTIGDLMDNPKGMQIISQIMGQFISQEDLENGPNMIAAMMKDMPIRAVSNFSSGAFNDDMIDNLLQILNQ